MIDISKVAQKATTLAAIMENKEKGDTEFLIYKKRVTINACEMVELINEDGEKELVWAFTISEEPEMFFFAGTVLKNVFEALLDACEGDYEKLYEAVDEQTLTVEFGEAKNKKGKKYTTVKVIRD